MKKLIVFLLICIAFCTNVNAQYQGEESGPIGHIILSNGTSVSSSYIQETNVLSIEVANNNDEVEIIIVEDDTIINSESTILEEDELQVELPMSSQPIYIYVRTKEETQYVGSVSKRD